MVMAVFPFECLVGTENLLGVDLPHRFLVIEPHGEEEQGYAQEANYEAEDEYDNRIHVDLPMLQAFLQETA